MVRVIVMVGGVGADGLRNMEGGELLQLVAVP